MELSFENQMSFVRKLLDRESLSNEEQQRWQAIQQLQARQAVYLHPDFKAVPEHHLDLTARIGYHPTAGVIPGGVADAKFPSRPLSRKRVIIGPVNFYFDDGEKQVNVITACAPNLMGTSEKDQSDFSKGSHTQWSNHSRKDAPCERHLKVDDYTDECNKLAQFILSSAKAEGIELLIMPAFGVGVYINTLSESSKEKAKKAMYRAFATAAEDLEISVQWIVWDGLADAGAECDFYNDLSSGRDYIMSITGDIFELAKADYQCNFAILNAGSDRTIGGLYTKKGATTMEEQIAQRSDLLFLQSATFNAVITQKMKEAYEKLPALTTPTAQLPLLPAAEPSPGGVASSGDRMRLAEKIRALLVMSPNDRHNPMVFETRISFKKKDEAQRFCNKFFIDDKNICTNNTNNRIFFSVLCDIFAINRQVESLKEKGRGVSEPAVSCKVVSLRLPFGERGADNNDWQAQQIVNLVKQAVVNGEKLLITYSANTEQFDEIQLAYNEKRLPEISGSNQAAVMSLVIKKLEEENVKIRQAFAILPVVTIDYKKEPGSQERINKCNEQMKHMLNNRFQENYVLFVWGNQNGEVAIGGGVINQPSKKGGDNVISSQQLEDLKSYFRGLLRKQSMDYLADFLQTQPQSSLKPGLSLASSQVTQRISGNHASFLTSTSKTPLLTDKTEDVKQKKSCCRCVIS